MATSISTIKINASMDRVWETITKAELVKLWQYGSDLITSWEAGSDIRFRTEWEGKVYEQWGKVLQVIPKESVKYSLFAPRPGLEDKPENYFIMTYSLTNKNGETVLKIIKEDSRENVIEEEAESEENPVLKSLKEVAERS